MKDIEWVPVNGYGNKYFISNYGSVRSMNFNKTGKEKELNLNKDKDGYLLVSLCKNGVVKVFKVHRLVGIHFIPNPDNLPEINHIFGNKKDNYFKHLEWSTRRNNCIHALTSGLKQNTTEKQKAAVLKTNKLKLKIVYQYTLQKVFIAEYLGLSLASTSNNSINHTNISACCLGKVKTAGGFIWSYQKI